MTMLKMLNSLTPAYTIIWPLITLVSKSLGGKGGGGLSYVRYTGMCHRQGGFFTYKNPEQALNLDIFSGKGPDF